MTMQGSVRLFNTFDGGNIESIGGVVTLDSGLETAAYLSLFGGNEDDTGQADSTLQWWANFAETDPLKQYRSQTQNIIDSLPASSGNLRRIEDAIVQDLAWMIPQVATSVEASARLSSPKRLEVAVSIVALGQRNDFKFSANWESES